MTLPALATISDVEARAGTTIDDLDQGLSLIAQASAIVRAYAGVTWTADDGALVDLPDGVSGTVVDMVVRVLDNPTGVTDDMAGPFRVGFGPNAAERLYLTAGEKLILDAVPGRRPRLGTISTTRGPVETRPVSRGPLDW